MPYDLTNWMMVFVRASAMLSVFPILSMRNFPVQLRIALGALVAFLITPSVPVLAEPVVSFAGTTGLMIKEVGIGLLLGFISRLLFYLLEFAGNLIATEMGLNMAATLSPFEGGRSEVPGTMLYYLGGMLFLCLDLHHWLLMGFQRSFQLVPIGEAHISAALFTEVISRSGELFGLGLLIAAPVIATSFLINLVFSVLGRAVPQMNVFVESFSFRILAGLLVLGLTFNVLAQHIINHLRRLPGDFLRVAQLLGAH